MRKFIGCADLHVRSNRPQFRTDNYLETVCRKLRQIVAIANKHNADILIAGDLFDSVKVGHKVVNLVLEILLELKGTAYATAGQHDMAYHTLDLDASPFKTLMLAGKIKFLTSEGEALDIYGEGENNDVMLYGCSFGEDPIKVKKNDFNILVIHKTITPEEPPFFLPDAISANSMLDNYPNYDLIVSGDFHEAFVAKRGNNTIVNCGPMMRESIDQVDVKPRVYLIDIDKNKIKSIYLDIEPAEAVFNIELAQKIDDSKFSEGLEELVDTLKSNSKRPDYKQTVDLIMKKSKAPKDVQDKVNEEWGKVINA